MAKKSKTLSNFIKFIDFPPFPLFGVPWAAVILGHFEGSGGALDPLGPPGLAWPSVKKWCRAGFAHEIGLNVIFLPVPWLVSAAVV